MKLPGESPFSRMKTEAPPRVTKENSSVVHIAITSGENKNGIFNFLEFGYWSV